MSGQGEAGQGKGAQQQLGEAKAEAKQKLADVKQGAQETYGEAKDQVKSATGETYYCANLGMFTCFQVK